MNPLRRLQSLWRRVAFARAAEHERVRLFPELGSVGTDVRLTGWPHFGSEPFLIHLGSHITISDDVAFITHDGGVRTVRDSEPDLHVYGEIRIGDGSFIGMRTIILPGVTIGARCVIGAGSVVTKDIPDGTVAAGVPCRPLRTIDEYAERSAAGGMRWPVGRYGGEDWRAAVIAHARGAAAEG